MYAVPHPLAKHVSAPTSTILDPADLIFMHGDIANDVPAVVWKNGKELALHERYYVDMTALIRRWDRSRASGRRRVGRSCTELGVLEGAQKRLTKWMTC
jgi:hypothetical protein